MSTLRHVFREKIITPCDNFEKTVLSKTSALLFCKGQNVTKIKFIFNLFAENGKFTKTQNFSEFQFAWYLSASYVILAIRVDLGGNYADFSTLENDTIKGLLDACQNKDCEHLVEVVDKKYFGEDGSKEYFIEDFKQLFARPSKEDSLGFILTSKGIRWMLEKNNV